MGKLGHAWVGALVGAWVPGGEWGGGGFFNGVINDTKTRFVNGLNTLQI